MGGFVGMRLALRHPELLRSLVLMGTSADPEPHRFKYQLMAWYCRVFGIRLIVGSLMHILFGTSFLADPERADERDRWRRHLLGLEPNHPLV